MVLTASAGIGCIQLAGSAGVPNDPCLSSFAFQLSSTVAATTCLHPGKELRPGHSMVVGSSSAVSGVLTLVVVFVLQ